LAVIIAVQSKAANLDNAIQLSHNVHDHCSEGVFSEAGKSRDDLENAGVEARNCFRFKTGKCYETTQKRLKD
jgi:hypothetical protein